MSKLKIVVIGGGSSYTPEIIEGFIKRYNELSITELWLVDIIEGKKKLEIVGNLAKRMLKKAGITCKVNLTLNREEALKDADFVTTQLRVGGLDARAIDESIPLSHGVLGQETNGAGGFAKAIRTIPVILDICKDMEKLCPNAWLINFTNPAGIITEAVLNNTNIKCIGLCNVPIGMSKAIAEVLNAKEDEFTFIAAGLNHYVWGREVHYKGSNRLNEIIDQIIDNNIFNPKNIDNISWIKEQIESTGMIPSPYHRYYYLADDMLKHALEDYNSKGTRAQQVQEVEKKLFELYENPNLAEKPKELQKRGGAYYSDAACNLINNIYNNKRNIMVVNTLNNGAINCLSDDSSIEVSSVITDCGAIPLNIKPFPISARGELQILKTFEKLTIKAALTGDYGTALQALTVNPLVPSGHIAKTILDELLEHHKKYLPQFYQK